MWRFPIYLTQITCLLLFVVIMYFWLEWSYVSFYWLVTSIKMGVTPMLIVICINYLVTSDCFLWVAFYSDQYCVVLYATQALS